MDEVQVAPKDCNWRPLSLSFWWYIHLWTIGKDELLDIKSWYNVVYRCIANCSSEKLNYLHKYRYWRFHMLAQSILYIRASFGTLGNMFKSFFVFVCTATQIVLYDGRIIPVYFTNKWWLWDGVSKSRLERAKRKETFQKQSRCGFLLNQSSDNTL